MSIQWLDDVLAALVELGGEGDLKEIYPLVAAQRSSRHAPLGCYQEWVRNTLQDNSRGRGKDVFLHIARGRWGVKGMTAAKETST